MWDSKGDIVARTVLRVVADDMTVSGKIDDHSTVVLVSTTGTITVEGKIDNHSNVTLKAAGGVMIGSSGGSDEDRKIDGSTSVTVVAGGDITLGSYVHNASVDFQATGTITITGVDYGATVRQIADGDIMIAGDIQGNEFDHSPSRVELVSNRGSITIDGKVNGQSNVYLTADMNISIGEGSGGPSNIEDASFVTAIAGGDISLGGQIHNDHTTVDFAAAGSVAVGQGIQDQVIVRMLSGAGSISVVDKIATVVTSWPTGALALKPGDTAPSEEPWADAGPLAALPARRGYWWENWGKTFGYVAPFRVVPHSVDNISKAVIGSGTPRRPDLTPVKAIGGGWSFTDAALPMQTQPEVDRASLLVRGDWQQQDVKNLLEGITDDTVVRPMDLLPQAVARNLSFSTGYNQAEMLQVTQSGAQLPASLRVRLIDTRSLASSLNCEFDEIRARDQNGLSGSQILFHVEAGITMADLQQLLDHQNPRLALRATGGSPGATLAGVLSTATHGGEFRWPLLVDCVRAIHLVGPGGLQWWIEGTMPVADPTLLASRYPGIQFIGGGWSAIPGLDAQDVLQAVTTSMGTMGVIYSVVLEVFPQFGVRQIVHPSSWSILLASAGTSETPLRSGSASANQAVLKALFDGATNGTGIPESENVYVDLAINPMPRNSDFDCWIVNRSETSGLPDDANGATAGIGDYLGSLSRSLSGSAQDRFQDSAFAGRIFDFLSYATDIGDLLNDANQASRLLGRITGSSDPFGTALALVNTQAILNMLNSGQPDRGLPFLRDVLEGFFHALEGTTQAEEPDGVTAPGLNSDSTGVAYRVGAIGWPDTGLPGRGLEIALEPDKAFTFLQTVLLDDVLAKTEVSGKNPLLGYISIRVCPRTGTLVGMQQFSRQTVMIEVVSYGSPEAATIMGLIQEKAMAFSTPGAKPLFHWGLENDRLNAGYLASTPLGQPYKGGFTRLDAFRAIRSFLRAGHPPVFDNNFTARLGL